MSLLTVRSNEQLIQYIDNNPDKEIEYVFFWGGIYSQWRHSPFTIDGIGYPTAEHWMMAEKARLFNDEDSLARILSTPHPNEAKKLGRKVKNFDLDVWNKHAFDIVVLGNWNKFQQNPNMKRQLIGEDRHKVIVEASPYDRIWGIGISDKDLPDILNNPCNWQGTNWLGYAIMEAREQIIKHDDITSDLSGA